MEYAVNAGVRRRAIDQNPIGSKAAQQRIRRSSKQCGAASIWVSVRCGEAWLRLGSQTAV
ncbi:hypothetical protein [Tychonema sp. LEGE 07203]|uniref:hypothetical protein n=1 Tax=Tychonema sp. LEGE 07203 TaxID=1828671 RepID=UPI0018820D66|nr:hypothetical protein [Tychonema sp. LEGE 07203]MBE9092886.1 hypothetical protein [Tychonema sp. LEGE 07203]